VPSPQSKRKSTDMTLNTTAPPPLRHLPAVSRRESVSQTFPRARWHDVGKLKGQTYQIMDPPSRARSPQSMDEKSQLLVTPLWPRLNQGVAALQLESAEKRPLIMVQ